MSDTSLDAPPDPAQAYLSDADKLELLRLEADHCKLAATDPVAFTSYVLREEETGQRIEHSPRHVEWHDFLSAHTRAIIWAHVEGGKTQQISIGRVLYEIGCNPQLRVVCVSSTFGQSEGICRAVARYISGSPELQRVFPNLRRHPRHPWNASEITVERRGRAKDPTLRTCGVYGKILGARIDLLIFDDILGYENTRTDQQRKAVVAWVKSTLEGRLTKNARVWAMGMIWHPEDLYHQLDANPLYSSIRGPVLRPDGRSAWPAVWPDERIATRRVEMGEMEFRRQMLCEEVSDEESRFKREWIEACEARGSNKTMTWMLQDVPPGYRIYTGVDLGVRDKETSAETVLFTIAIHPDESRELLWIEAGKWGGPDIVAKVIDTHHRFRSIVFVENVAAQNFILQFTQAESAVPVVPFETTGSKMWHPDFGVESLGVEMANQKWIIPSKGGLHPEVVKWKNELMGYQPGQHCGDRLMASWFAREGARLQKPKKKIQRRRVNLLSR